MFNEDLLKDIKGAEAAESVQEYLKKWIIQRHKTIWRNFVNCKPKLEEFLKLQALANSMEMLQQELYIRKLKGEDARQALEEMETATSLIDKM